MIFGSSDFSADAIWFLFHFRTVAKITRITCASDERYTMRTDGSPRESVLGKVKKWQHNMRSLKITHLFGDGSRTFSYCLWFLHSPVPSSRRILPSYPSIHARPTHTFRR